MTCKVDTARAEYFLRDLEEGPIVVAGNVLMVNVGDDSRKFLQNNLQRFRHNFHLNNISFLAMFVAQLAGGSILIPEDTGSNPVIILHKQSE